ncbi:hypothetical protein [Petralouisia muris]|nr:hypothetical protein [Petralouisia muris]
MTNPIYSRIDCSKDVRKDTGEKNQKLIITVLDEFMEETPVD